jgi:molybdenum cofactor synthesis domain-containing protein
MKNAEKTPTAAVLIIGNEILSGRTQDVNLNYIAQKLTSIGVRLSEARVVPDIEDEIVDALNALRKRYTYVFTTGGIGPTHDDITADSVGKAFGVPVTENPEARQRLENYYKERGVNAARLRMARTPEGASLIDNPISAAPGIHIGNVYVLAGVPDIMQAMMDNIVSTLKYGPAIHSVTVSGFVAESIVATELEDIAKRYPQLDIGSYPWVRQSRYGTALVARGTDGKAAQEAAEAILVFVKKHDPGATLSAE